MIIILLVLVGLALGSFINALIWRMHVNQTTKQKLSIANGRSMCPNCKHQLAWYDLIPVISWLTLGGKCRYCKKPISIQYPVVEIIFSALLVVSYLWWPYELGSLVSWVLFSLWVVMLVLLVAMALYDIKWLELPTELIYLLGIVSTMFVGVMVVDQEKTQLLLSSVIGAIGLGGLFYILYQVSKGGWIGGGDVRLGFVMGLFLGWQQALLGLSLAAYIGTLIVVVAVVVGKYKKRMKLPFGPLLITGWFISFLWGQQIIDWYLGLIGISA